MNTRAPHIAVVASYFYPKIGGLENYAYLLAKKLHDRNGYRISVITSNYEGTGYQKEVLKDMTVYRLPISFKISNTPMNLFWYWQIKKIFEEDPPDLIHLHAPVPYMADMAALAAGDLPVVLTYHSGSMLKGAMPADIVIGTYERIGLSALFRRANAVVAISQAFAKRAFPQFTDKIYFIPTGVDTKRFQKTPLPKTTRRVTFVGRIEHSSSWKGIDVLLQAMVQVIRKIPDATLELIGGGDAVEYFREYARGLGIGESVFLPGPLIGNELVMGYQRANVVVLPSTSDAEAFSIALVEAMASGRPIIGSKIGGIPQAIEDKYNGILVPPKDPPALASAIINVLEDETLATTLAEHGAKRAQKFAWDKQADKYIRLFAPLMP